MQHTQHDASPTEGWLELVAWDEEPSNTKVGSHTQGSSFADGYQFDESFIVEEPYLISAPPSVIEGPSSMSHTVSNPPSIIDGQSSFGQAFFTSLSFGTSATSPLLDHDSDQYFGSFGACDSRLPSSGRITESPILDTRYERIADSLQSSIGSFESTQGTLFNPHVANSSHAFSSLDVRASQVLNIGTWVDQPQIVEPTAVCDETRAEVGPIPIPRPQPNYEPRRFYSPSEGADEVYGQSRAIPIPTTTNATYNARAQHTQWTQRAPPLLSVSPVAQRRSRGTSLSSSASQNRRKIITSSPTEPVGWVSYQPNPLTNKLAPTSSEGSQGRTPRGRKKGLTAEQRSHAALMRIIGACSNCQRRKEKCDAGTPCRSCLGHFKSDLVKYPCRNRLISDLSHMFLSDRLGWHPTFRSVDSFVESGSYEVVKEITYTVPLNFGFGPAMPVPVHAIRVGNFETLNHEHVIFPWPPDSAPPKTHQHAVLPALVTAEGASNLMQLLDSHLSLLVSRHFHAFPLYCSELRILRDVYIFCHSLPSNSSHRRILHQALKLLALVHIGGDITLPSRSGSNVLAQLITNSMRVSEDLEPTPCFIRSQFGVTMPVLASSLMKEVLSELEQLLLNRDTNDWPVALAILITVLMTVESIHYHAAKLPYHHEYDSDQPLTLQENLGSDDDCVNLLLDFYRACFSGCHARLRPDWEGEAVGSAHKGRQMSADDTFIEGVRLAIKNADGARYLTRKARETRRGDDMGFFFDRLVARLLLLRP
ncbi:hypothetical protein ACN47E_002383 [Coniothyrium glycines]